MINYSIEVKKIIEEVTPSKHNPMYDASMYWSQKAYNIADKLIELFTKKGDVVFDPFLGSGVTLIESISNNLSRRAVGCEINEEPVFLINTALKIRKLKSTQNLLEQFIKQLDNIESKYYKVICEECQSEGTINQVVFDFENQEKKIKAINYKCNNPNCKCKIKHFDEDVYATMNRKYEILNIENTKLIPNSKLAVKENMRISDIFTTRNFKVLDEIVGIKGEYKEIEDVIDYILLGIIHLSKITDTHSNSQWPLWIPNKDCVEKNVIAAFKRRAEKVLKMIKYKSINFSRCYKTNNFNALQRKCGYLILNKGIQTITNEDLSDDSIDFILTDPPYMGQVAYSEYMQLYKPFLKLNFNLDDEIVVSSSPYRNKNFENYFELIDQAFEVCSKKLKDEHFMCMYFHDCSLDVWNNLIGILSKHGFKYVSQVHVDKTKTLKNIISPKKSLNGDSLLIFKKIKPISYEINKVEGLLEIEENIIREAKHMIRENGPQSTPELYDNGLMEIIICNNWLTTLSEKYNSLVDVFEKYLLWIPESARWDIKNGNES